jgi:membrane-bound lytic murein transglycosylase MltF
VIRNLLSGLLAAVLAWGCRASPDTDTGRSTLSHESSQSAESDAPSDVTGGRSASDSAALADTLLTEVAPFVRPLAGAWKGDLDSMIARRVIRVLITPTRTQYWIDLGRQTGVEYELLRAFEDWLSNKYPARRHINTHVVFIPTSRDELIPRLEAGLGDIAAGILTLTPDRLARVDAGGPFFRGVKEVPVTGPESPAVSSLDDLSGQHVVVRRSSSYWSHLEQLNSRFTREGKPPIRLEAAPEDLADDDLLEMVNAGLIDITVVDRYAARLWSKILPDLRVHEEAPVNEGGEVGWLIRKGSPKLKQEIDDFAKSHGQGSSLGNQLVKKYTGSARFLTDARSPEATKRYRQVVDLFRKYGDQYSLDYLLVLAQGYQESRLKQSARSPVGAVGVMQVMPATGEELGVGDINQMDPNIHAGVKYIRLMIDQHFAGDSIDPLNQTLLAFAAYNAGPGRVRRLRAEAASLGLNPNVWRNNVELVAARRIGAETVTYVANIYKYYVAYRLVQREQEERQQEMERLRSRQKPVAPTSK